MTATTGVPAPRDPMHDRPVKPTVDELRREVETIYGRTLHGERVAATAEARGAFHLVAAWLDQLLWPVTP